MSQIRHYQSGSVFSNIVTTDVQKTLEYTNAWAKHTYVIANIGWNSQSYFLQCTLLLLNSTGLRVHQRKQRMNS